MQLESLLCCHASCLSVLRRALEKGENRYRDISLATVLSYAFNAHHMMVINRRAVVSNITYQEAEQLSEAYANVMGMEIPPSAIMPSEKNVDAAIESYRQYTLSREIILDFGYEEGDVDAFCKMVENAPADNGLLGFFLNNYYYLYAIRNIYDYINGVIDKEHIILMSHDGIKLHPMTDTEVFAFARNMTAAVRKFKEITEKRNKRKPLKDNKC